MSNPLNTALAIGTVGLIVNRFQDSKLAKKTYLSEQESQLKLTGGAVAFLGYSSAAIIHFTEDKPKARKVAFVSLGVVSVGMVLSVLYALKKMS